MKLLSAVIVFIILTEVFCEESGPDDYQNLINSDQIHGEWLSSDPLNTILRRMTRKPRPQQFFGLMGRRSSRQKLNSFVGLMGKRSQVEPDLYEWDVVDNYNQNR